MSRKMVIIVLMACMYLTSGVFADWKDAVNSEGLVRIPLRNPQGHSWFANL